jgi:Fe2+-dicitrate sensor, membrane component
MTKEQFLALLNKYRQQQLTAEEIDLFLDALEAAEVESWLTDEMLYELEQMKSTRPVSAAREEKVWNQIKPLLYAEEPVKTAHRVHFIRQRFFRYAAAVLVAGVLGGYFYMATKNKPTTVAPAQPVAEDVLPGTNKALLTLSDGTTIALDAAANGAIAQQGNASIVKMADGVIRYDVEGHTREAVMINTMTTPRGGQYQLTLPDGTRVWLNAASSITYPAVFVGNDRKVKVSGEVYLEVAKDATKPFCVDIDGQSAVEVLGTSFNINAYADDGAIKTALLEGKVKVKGVKEVILKPGQEAVVSNKNTRVWSGVEAAQVLAWKNGLFSFDNTDLRLVAKQIERWYDIEVQFAGPVPDLTLKGKMDRNVRLSDLIRFLDNFGVKTRLNGKTLIVL